MSREKTIVLADHTQVYEVMLNVELSAALRSKTEATGGNSVRLATGYMP